MKANQHILNENENTMTIHTKERKTMTTSRPKNVPYKEKQMYNTVNIQRHLKVQKVTKFLPLAIKGKFLDRQRYFNLLKVIFSKM